MSLTPDAQRIWSQLLRGRTVCRTDFLAPDVIDGGKPIINLPARILEIKQEFGDAAVVDTGMRRNRCKVFIRGELRDTSHNDVELTCGRHFWPGYARHCAAGYAIVSEAGPTCPTCGREPVGVDAPVRPVHPEVRERAAA